MLRRRNLMCALYDEIEKGKGCPEGMHAHDGSIHCHPVDKPHKPGSKSDIAHRKLGLANTWYEQHGTTQEEYDKEHGEETEEKTGEGEESAPEAPETPKEEPKSDEPLGAIQYQAVRDMHNTIPEYREKIIKTRKLFNDIKDNPNYKDLSNDEYYNQVFMPEFGKVSYYTKYGWEVNPKTETNVLNNYSREEVNRLIENQLEVTENFPAVGFVWSSMAEYHRAVMAFDGSKMGLCLNPKKACREDVQMGTEKYVIKDPVTKQDSEWSFHFAGCDSFNSVQHEYGHAVSRYLACLKASKEYPSQKELEAMDSIVEEKLKEIAQNDEDSMFYGASLSPISRKSLPRMGYKGIRTGQSRPEKWRYPYFFIPRAYTTGESWRVDNTEDLPKIKEELNKVLEGTGFELDEPMSYSEDGWTKYAFRIKKTSDKKGERIQSMLKDRNFEETVKEYATSPATTPVQTIMQKERVRDCEALYKKIFKVKKIVPSDCYSEYGFYGRGVENYTGRNMPTKGLDDVNSDERLAEAFQDVCQRKEKANSMSQLLVAHTYYELAQLTQDYQGTFEDYVTEKIGMDLFKERIIKFGKPVWFSYLVWDRENPKIAKGFRKDTPKYILDMYRDDYNRRMKQ